MKKYLTRRDIMELLCITNGKFMWAIKQLRIIPFTDMERLLFYTIQDMINIYDFVYNSSREIILESKINYKPIKL